MGHVWGVLDYERDEENLSPNYANNATKMIKNLVTNKDEPHFPIWIAMIRRLLSILVLIAFLGVAFFSHMIIIMLRLSLHHVMFLSEGFR